MHHEINARIKRVINVFRNDCMPLRPKLCFYQYYNFTYNTISIFCIFVFVFMVTACQPIDPTTNNNQYMIQLSTNDIMTAKPERYQPNISVTGTLQPSQTAIIQAPNNAKVHQIFVQVNDAIQQEQPLVVLHQYANETEEKTTENQSVLTQNNHVQKTYHQTILTAPIAGVISEKFVKEQEKVNENQKLIEISDFSQLIFKTTIPSSIQNQISIGNSVPFTVENFQDLFVGQISYIKPQTDNDTMQTIYIKVKPNDKSQQLQSGMKVTGKIDYGQIKIGILVPAHAISLHEPNDPQPKRGYVWIIQQNHQLLRQPINIIEQYKNTHQYLISGIEAGAVIVLAPLSANDTGKFVTIK